MKTTTTKALTNAQIKTITDCLNDTRDNTAAATAALRHLKIGDYADIRLKTSTPLTDVADESWDDDMGNAIYRIASVFIHRDGGNTCHVSAETTPDVVKYLSSWDTDSHGTYEDMLVAFGIEPDLDEIYTGGSDEMPEDEPGDFAIWVRYCYNAGCGTPTDGWARDDHNEILTFDSIHAACEGADEMESEQYERRDGQRILHLAHNQAGSTDFVVCRR